MTKTIESSQSNNLGMNMSVNDTGNNVSYSDFGSNEIVVYRKKGLGATIVASLWVFIALGVVLSFSSILLYSKSMRMSRDVIAKSNELIGILKEDSEDTRLHVFDENDNTHIDDNRTVDTSVKKTPVKTGEDKLTALKMVASEGATIENNCQNTVGDTFERAIVCRSYDDPHVTYYLNGKYSTISADVSVLDHSWVSEQPYTFEVFADNNESELLFSTTLSRVSATQHIEIDVSGVEFITFRAHYGGCDQYPTFILSDAVVLK